MKENIEKSFVKISKFKTSNENTKMSDSEEKKDIFENTTTKIVDLVSETSQDENDEAQALPEQADPEIEIISEKIVGAEEEEEPIHRLRSELQKGTSKTAD